MIRILIVFYIINLLYITLFMRNNKQITNTIDIEYDNPLYLVVSQHKKSLSKKKYKCRKCKKRRQH